MVEISANVVGNLETKLNKIQGQLLSVNKKFKDQGRQIATLNAKLTSYHKKMNKTNTQLKKTSGYAKNAAAGFAMLDRQTRSGTATTKKHNKVMSNLVMQYFGVQAVISLASRAFQAFLEYTKQGIKSFRSFEQRMREVSTILTDVGGNLTNLTAGIEGMSKTFGKSADDLAKGLYNILSAAVPVEESLQFLYIASRAAVAGITSVEKSVDVLTTVYNAYGKTVAQMQSVSDTMFQAVIRGKFRFEDLASALGYVVPIASQVGITFEELAASMATATRNGQHIDMVSRGLAMSIQNIIKPSAKAKKTAADLGIELNETAIRARGLTGYLEYLNEKAGGNASVISQIIPNMRSYRVMMVLAGNSVEGVTKDTELMNTSLEQTEKAFNKVISSTQSASDIIDQYGEDVKRMTGEVTSGIDLLLRKFDMFKGFFMTSLFTKPGGVFTAIADGIRNTSRVMSILNKQLDRNTEKWKESLKAGSQERPESLFEQVLSGEDIDTSKITDAKEKYEDLMGAGIEYAEALKQARSSGMPKDELMIMELQFEDLQTQILAAESAYNVFESSLDDATDSVDRHGDAITSIVTRMEELENEIGTVGELYDGELGHQLKVAEQSKIVGDMSHYISLAKEEEQYQLEAASNNYSWYTANVDDAITTIREYEKQTKEATQAQNEFNAALARNRIETMKIQLIGMMRRRGNTRAEQRILKKLSIERTEMQIEAAEKELDAELNKNGGVIDSREEAYNQAVDLIDKLQRQEEHKLWVVKDTNNREIQDLRHTIATKESIYLEYNQTLKENQDEMNESLQAYKTLAATIYGEELPLEIQKTIDALEKAVALQNQLANKSKVKTSSGGGYVGVGTGTKYKAETKSGKTVSVSGGGAVGDAIGRGEIRDLFGFARGTNYVPSTGLYQLHKGEQVLTRQEVDRSNNGITVNVTVSGNTIADTNTEEVARQIADQVQKGLVDARTGKTKYRMR